MSQHGALTKQQAEYVAMVCQGQNHTDIASVLKVDRRTLIRWSKLGHVQAAIAQANDAASKGVAEQQQQQYKEIARSAQAATTELLEKLVPASIKVVATILTDAEAKHSDRLKAAELLTKWGGLGQTANQPQQQSSEQVLNLYLATMNASNN